MDNKIEQINKTLDRMNDIHSYGFGLQQWVQMYKEGVIRKNEALQASAASAVSILRIIQSETNQPLEEIIAKNTIKEK